MQPQQDELLNVAFVVVHSSEKLFKDLTIVRKQATSARDKRAETPVGQRKYESPLPWRVVDMEFARITKAKATVPARAQGCDLDHRDWSGRIFNDDLSGQRVVLGLF
eukprot:7020123-Pyramimonas_sp.AAC.1